MKPSPLLFLVAGDFRNKTVSAEGAGALVASAVNGDKGDTKRITYASHAMAKRVKVGGAVGPAMKANEERHIFWRRGCGRRKVFEAGKSAAIGERECERIHFPCDDWGG